MCKRLDANIISFLPRTLYYPKYFSARDIARACFESLQQHNWNVCSNKNNIFPFRLEKNNFVFGKLEIHRN